MRAVNLVWPRACCARRRELCLPPCSSKWPSSPPLRCGASSLCESAAGDCQKREGGRRTKIKMLQQEASSYCGTLWGHLTLWSGCGAPRSHPLAFGCSPPSPPPPVSASSPPPGASGCSSGRRQGSRRALMFHCRGEKPIISKPLIKSWAPPSWWPTCSGFQMSEIKRVRSQVLDTISRF